MNEVLLRHCQAQGRVLPLFGIGEWREERKSGDEMKGGSGEVVTLHWPSFPAILVAGCQHEVGGSLDSGELAEVGTSEVERLGRSGGAAEVAPGSGTGAGQSQRPALSTGLLRSATDLSKGSDVSGPLSGPVFSLGKWTGCA